MATRLTQALFRTDPTAGFIDYVQTVKPYHTKILESLVEYVWTEPINVTVCDRLDWNIQLLRPQPPVVYDCGFGVMWDPPLPFIHTTYYINGVVTGLGGSWTVVGNHASMFTPGSLFVVGRNVGGGSGWYTVASAVNVGPNTVVTVVETIPVGPLSPHAIAYLTDATVELILDSDPSTNSFVVVGDQTQKFLPGAMVRVDNTYQGRNNGVYIVQTSYLELTDTRVFVKQKVVYPKPISQTYDGRMYLALEGYDQPPYCALLQAGDLHTDVFIHEHITFDYSIAFTETAGVSVLENEPRGYGVVPYGSIFTAQQGHPATAPTTGITILPTGIDGQYFNVGGIDETVDTVINFYGRSNV